MLPSKCSFSAVWRSWAGRHNITPFAITSHDSCDSGAIEDVLLDIYADIANQHFWYQKCWLNVHYGPLPLMRTLFGSKLRRTLSTRPREFCVWGTPLGAIFEIFDFHWFFYWNFSDFRNYFWFFFALEKYHNFLLDHFFWSGLFKKFGQSII